MLSRERVEQVGIGEGFGRIDALEKEMEDKVEEEGDTVRGGPVRHVSPKQGGRWGMNNPPVDYKCFL